MANLILEQIEYKLGDVNRSTFDSKNASLMTVWRPEQYYFNKKQIIPFVDEHWKDICTDRARTTTWWATLGSCLYSTKEIFTSKDERQRSAAADFGLNDANLWHIRPIQSSTKSTTSIPRLPKERKSDEAFNSQRMEASSIYPTANSQRVEKWVASNTPSPRSSSPSVTPAIIPAMFSNSSNTDHPFNRFGFKYIPCEKSKVLPHLAYQQTDISGVDGNGCTLSMTDKSSYVSVAKDGRTVTTDKGFRMCRANVGVKEGNWYWEAIVLKSNDDSGGHVRLGWARREACLNAPVGYDAYSYGYRDKTGEKVFCSRPQSYGESYQTGDVIGLYISLPPKHKNGKDGSTGQDFKSATRKRIPIAFKDTIWFEEKDYRQCKEMEALADRYRKEDDSLYRPKSIPGSSITMYKNGVCLGVMYQDLTDFEDFGSLPDMVLSQHQKKKRKHKKDSDSTLPTTMTSGTSQMRMVDEEDFDGNVKHQQWNDDPPLADDGSLGYYPAVSVYKGGVVSCNFGPDFQYPPPVAPGTEPWKPMCQRHSDYMVEECVWDLVDEISRSFRKKFIE
ncbi:uncharacterized protein BX664DRAFT_364085 [Halteromyces radiatus]|uniref:uncharacterized protein n=1 Tax=Halteromyces radiatus TaxID=101107 RepID=UPI002220A029|nr:uncharacterized protein BX664DRAFT_364085 [Halteromyces radiatus]KAI8096903.1 hypothetical protein BX664DRAFT_364085 [Halteromyces radiatus]